MTLLSEILKWTESLPAWQRDASRRLLIKESGLDETDYSELYLLLKKEYGIPIDVPIEAAPLANEHIPAQVHSEQPVTIVALRDLENVNRIPNTHTLAFIESGITIIYGENGAGKSGYARVLKRACRARDQSESIHPNLNDPEATNSEPRALFDVKMDGVLTEIEWARDSKPPDALSSISVFDSKCARSFVTDEKEAAYLPYGLDVVENLARLVIPRLSEKLKSEIDCIDVGTLPLNHLFGETKVGRAVESLSAETDVNDINSLGTLTESDINRIAELQSALNETNPLDRANIFNLSAMRLKTYADKVTKPLRWVSSSAVKKLEVLNRDRIAAENAENVAANALRAGEALLPGTGNQQWKLLFEAARRYSMEDACSHGEFPPSFEQKICPLCQEKLPDSAIDRLNRFDEYIKNDVSQTASQLRQRVEEAKSRIETADLRICADPALRDELMSLDETIVKAITAFQTSIDARRTFMLQCLTTSSWREMPSLEISPRARIRQLAAQQLKACRTQIRAADEVSRTKLAKELAELKARQSLASSLEAVVDLHNRMKKKVALERCQLSLDTRPISNKSKELASKAITDELKAALSKEFKKLGIGNIETNIKERTDKGKVFHRLVLSIPTSTKIDEILSEGEQRAIALASFFAELALARHFGGIIFDDPVSSLDHFRRGKVANRLVEEAKVRQVVVLTHDTSFLGQLRERVEAEGVPHSILFLEWRDNSPGCVSDGLPWDHQGYKERIDTLEQAQSKLAKIWPDYPGEEERSLVRHEYDRLRATIERVVQDVVFNGAIKRYRDWIRVNSLDKVVGFNQTEYQMIYKLYKKVSDIINSHDKSSDKAESVPDMDELGSDIAVLKEVVRTINDRRKNQKSDSMK